MQLLDAYRDWRTKSAIRSNSRKRSMVYRALARSFERRLDEREAVEELLESVATEGEDSPLVLMAYDVVASVKDGDELYEGFDGWVPPNELMLIKEGHKDYGKAFRLAGRLAEVKGKIRSVILNSTWYPLLCLGFTYWIFEIMGRELFPVIETMLPRHEWHGWGQFVGESVYLVKNWLLLCAGFVGLLCYWIYWTMDRDGGDLRRWADRHVMPWSLVRMEYGLGFLMAFAALVEIGLTEEIILDRMLVGATDWLSVRIESALYFITIGEPVGKAFYLAGDDFPDRQIVLELKSETKDRVDGATLTILANQWADEGLRRVTRAGEIIFLAGLGVSGGVTLFCFTGFMSLIWQMKHALMH